MMRIKETTAMDENRYRPITPRQPEQLNVQEKTAASHPGMLQIFWSMLAAFCGVQNNANHDRDNAYIETVGFRPYIIAGIVLTIAVIVGLWLITKLIIG